MDLFSYFEFVKKALFLDKENPVKEWQFIEEEQEKICKYLNKVEKLQVYGEVFTAPVENSVSGHIRFTFLGIY